jgi:hypothetical protein
LQLSAIFLQSSRCRAKVAYRRHLSVVSCHSTTAAITQQRSLADARFWPIAACREGLHRPEVDGLLGSVSERASRSLPQPLYQPYEITVGILDDEFALAYFYIVSPIPGVFAFSIEWTSSLIKFLDDGCSVS